MGDRPHRLPIRARIARTMMEAPNSMNIKALLPEGMVFRWDAAQTSSVLFPVPLDFAPSPPIVPTKQETKRRLQLTPFQFGP